MSRYEELQPEIHCPVEAALAVIGGKWKVVILYHLMNEGVHRFAELRRKIPGVSERMLTQQLRELEDDGVVHRQVYPEVPPRVEYSVTDYGRTLRKVTEVMCEWGARHLKRTGRRCEPISAGDRRPMRQTRTNRRA